MSDVIDTGAEFSKCGLYRYKLWRTWDADGPRVAFIGLNPSTADAENNDPTVTRCINYANRWGYGGMWMLNLFAFRATDPKDMKAETFPVSEPFEPWRNESVIVEVFRESDLCVCCWGVHGQYQSAGRGVAKWLSFEKPLHCLGVTKSGHPRHPLYLKSDLKPQLFRGYDQ